MVRTYREGSCEPLGRVAASLETCVEGLSGYREQFKGDRVREIEQGYACLAGASGCDAVLQCLAQVRGSGGGEAGEAAYRKCEDHDALAPVRVDEAGSRHGAATERFSQIGTSKEQPIEVCGVKGQLQWLARVRCDDGSNPFQSLEQAHASRDGNVGPGGRCGGTIDLYRVPCPEKEYEVYMDLYMCAAGEEF
jgi:hypothetical protein